MESLDQPLTRRRFVKVTGMFGIAAGGLVALTEPRTATARGTLDSGGASADSLFGQDTLAGRLASIRSAREAVISPPDGSPEVNVVLQPEADVIRGYFGQGGDFSSFRPGEMVFVGGEFVDGAFNARHLRSLYRRISGTVNHPQSDEMLDTSAGALHIPSRRNRRVTTVPVGSAFTAEVWDDPDSASPAVLALTAV